MAITRLTIEGFGQLELNNCAFRRDGRIEAQCKPNATDFANTVLENGMILAIDQIAREVTLPSASSDLYALNYSTEHMYDERANGLNDISLERGTFLPRLGFLSVGELFTTNCISMDKSDYADEDALAAATTATALGSTPLYGGINSDGSILVSDSEPQAGPVLLVVEQTTMPDGQFALKFQVLKA